MQNNFPLIFTAFAYAHIRKVAISGIETGILSPEHISMFLQYSFYCSMYPAHRASSEVTNMCKLHSCPGGIAKLNLDSEYASIS